jgi:hypothetical protein
MAAKVIVWGTGSVGRLALREFLRNPDDFELVGVKVYSDEKVGKDAADLCDAISKTGIKAVEDVSDLPLVEADCVFYCPMVADCDEIAGLLRAGVNVVTTASNVYPKFYGAEVYNKLEEAGRAGGTTFHGSGVNPAFMSDVLPLTLSGLSHQVKTISVTEVSDVNHYASTAPEIMCDHIGFGKSAEEALHADDFLHGMTAYFSESLLAITDHLCVELERVDENHEVALTRELVVLANGRRIEPGTVGCRRFEWTAIVNGKPRIRLVTFWKLTTNLDKPEWDISSSELVEWTVTVEGTPSLQCKVATAASFDPNSPMYRKGGEVAAMEATANHAVNAVPFVVRAEPGVKTFLDLPVIASAGAFRN